MSSSVNGRPRAAVDINCALQIELGPSCRLNRSRVSDCPFLLVDRGVLALETTPSGGRRQVLDFFMAGDVIPTAVAVTALSLNVRAVNHAILSCHQVKPEPQGSSAALHCQRLLDRLCSHLSRRNLHQIMIGQLDADSRVASFLVALALRTCGALRNNLVLALPMSRNDIADYLAINSDTLSRIMMRYETSGILERLNRHALKLIDVDRLGQRTTLRAHLLAAHAAENGAAGPPAASTSQPEAAASAALWAARTGNGGPDAVGVRRRASTPPHDGTP
jgi:CRP/FNR family transcriptional regulator